MHLTLKDMLGIFAFTVGPMGTLMLIMWRHFNSSIHNLRGELKGDLVELRGELKGDLGGLRGELGGLRGELKGELKELRGELTRIDEKLSGKIDAVRDRVSRIEGLLTSAKIMPSEIMPAEEIKSKEITDQKIKPKEITDQKEALEDTKEVTVSYAQKLQQESRPASIQQVVSRMLKDNQPIDKIIRWTGINKDSIKKLKLAF